MGSRSHTSSLMFALAGLTIGASCVYAAGCGSNSATSSSSDAGDGGTGQTGPKGPFPEAGNLQCGADTTDWPMFGQNVCNTNSQAAAGGISPQTVGTLGVKWVYSASGDISATPTVVGGNVYVPDWGGYITRLDAATGTVAWSKKIDDIFAAGGIASGLHGFTSRNAPVVSGNELIFGTIRSTELFTNGGPSAYLVAIDKDTAALKWATLLDKHKFGVIAGSPSIDGNTVYVGVSSQEEFGGIVGAYNCCSFRGSVAAVDATTGKIKWQTYSIADSLYYANDAGKLSGFAGAAVWSSTPVVDHKRNQLYFTTGNNYHYSGKGESDAGAAEGNYVDAVVALDLDTGSVVWARSLPEGGRDLWVLNGTQNGPDSDFGAGANLFTTTINGKLTDVVGAGQKSGVYFALDANTGETLWSTQVAPGGHLGGVHWGTATDGTRVYMESNFNGTEDKPFVLAGDGAQAGMTAQTGTWSALDVSTGKIAWQVTNPVLPNGPQGTASCNGPVAVVNGVLFAGSMDTAGTMFAFDASNGKELWRFPSGGTVYGGPAISNGVVYWGSGFPSSARPLGFGSPSMKLYAFALGAGTDGGAASGGEGGTDAGTDGPSE